MRKITLIIGFLIVLILSGMVSAEVISSTVTPGEPIVAAAQTLEINDIPVCNTGSCDVLWDISHGDSPYDGVAQYAGLISFLQGNGYTVTTTSSSVATPGAFDNYEILVVNVGSSTGSAYTTAEVDAIESFVNNGGGLLVLADNSNYYAGNIKPVINRFGADTVSDIFAELDITDIDASHKIFTGVTTVYMNRPGTFNLVSPATAVAWTGGQPVIAVVDGKKVVMLGDCNMFQDQYNFIGRDDNWQLAKNVFAFLCNKGGTPVPEFPSLLLPFFVIAGFLGTVFIIQRSKEN